MKINNLRVSKKAVALAAAGALALAMSGCGNYDGFDMKYVYNQYI